MTESLAELFPDDPPRFLARTPHGYHDVVLIRSELQAAGFSEVGIETRAEQSRAPSPRHPAVAFCQGTPLRNEIESRDASALEAATDHAAKAIAMRHGSGAKDAAHVITAVPYVALHDHDPGTGDRLPICRTECRRPGRASVGQPVEEHPVPDLAIREMRRRSWTPWWSGRPMKAGIPPQQCADILGYGPAGVCRRRARWRADRRRIYRLLWRPLRLHGIVDHPAGSAPPTARGATVVSSP